jgi:hypothetical protein
VVRKSLLVVAAIAALVALPSALYVARRPESPRIAHIGIPPTVFSRESDDPAALRVLFVGNSFTFGGGGVPQVFASFDAAAKRPSTVASVTAGGVSLEDHWRSGGARAALGSGVQWRYVVLQDRSDAALAGLESLRAHARAFDTEIRAIGARTVLFMTWADSGRPENQETIAHAYEALAAELDVQVASVGRAWTESGALRPRLYEGDGHHANALGAYLAGCVIFSTITGRPSDGLPAPANVRALASDADIALLQQVATRSASSRAR